MSTAATAYKSPLHRMTQTTATCLWNDSASVEELRYAIDHGAVGATCNPVIAVEVIRKEMAFWVDRLLDLIDRHPSATEDTIAWRLVEEVSVRAATLLQPVFEAQHGRNGRLSVQTDPRLYRDSEAILQQATRFATLAPNIIVKIPVTSAGVAAIEEATFRGISVNATVSFSLSQCLAVAEAVERGLERRIRAGLSAEDVSSVCTVMVGRLDDWLKVVAEQRGTSVDPGVFEWSGVAVFKKAYAIFRARRYRIRLLSAAFRNHMHWSELIGGDIVISPPHKWQVRFNASDVDVVSRIDTPIEPRILATLMKFDDFRRAYAEDGLALREFELFPPSRRTLRQFIAACDDLNSIVRDAMLPDPDRASSQ